MDKKIFNQIKNDFSWVEQDDHVLSVLLFGSMVTDEHHAKSDTDIAVVVPSLSQYYFDCKNVSHEKIAASTMLRRIFANTNTSAMKYDIYLFEELPLSIQMNIIHNNKIVYTADRLGMSEYFYHYWKRWNDQKHRNTMSKKALLSSL